MYKSHLNETVCGTFMFSLKRTSSSQERPSVHFKTIEKIAAEEIVFLKVECDSKNILRVEFDPCLLKTAKRIARKISKELGTDHEWSLVTSGSRRVSLEDFPEKQWLIRTSEEEIYYIVAPFIDAAHSALVKYTHVEYTKQELSYEDITDVKIKRL